MSAFAEITVFAKSGGPLSKHIELIDGKIANDSSSCRMAKGSARRVRIDLGNMQAFAGLINAFGPQEAYAIGRLKPGLPDRVRIVRADKLKGDPSVIARTKDNIVFVEGEPGLVLQDIDLKGIPEDAKSRIKAAGGVWAVVCAVVPALASAARVVRPSTSHGLRNKETGETYAGSGGFHAAVAIADAADIPRFLADMHDRLWLAGYGWGISSAAGSFLERSLVDKACGSAERLIFEGPPIIEPPLEQAPRPAVAHPGDILDTKIACPTLTDAEKEELERLKRAERARLKPHLDEARAKWSEGHIERMVAAGATKAAAHAQVDRWIDHQELSGDFPLPFDDPRLAGAAAAAVLATPDRFVLKTLADPFEGPAYGRGKAILYRRKNGSLFINSFAHGGSRYELKAAPEPGPDSGPDPADAEIERLAKLLPLKYERERKAAAEALGLRASLLDRLVVAAQARLGLNGPANDGLPGRPITFDEPEPWPEPVDGEKLLTDIAEAIGKYVIIDACQRDTAALGAVFTHTHDLRDVAPIFFIVSPTKRCGKTRLERVIKRLARKPIMASSANPAFLARAIEKHRPTVIIDEFDALAAGDQAMAETLRGQLNSSFDRDSANTHKCVPLPGGGYDERAFSTYAATWIAGIKTIPDTVEDRSIVLRLKRKLPSEKVARFRGKDGGELDVLKRKIIRFVADNEQRLGEIEPEAPAALEKAGDRAADAWEPLFAIADVAGGDWPRRARAAAIALCGADDDEDAERNIHTVLLADIRDIFARLPPRGDAAHGAQGGRPDDGPRILTKQLLIELHGLEERPWIAFGRTKKPLTDTGLASLLRPYRIRSNTVRGEGGDRGRGYFLRSFKDAFSRYLPIPMVSTRAIVPNPANTGESEDFEDVPNSVWHGSENAENPSNSGLRHNGTGLKGGDRGIEENDGSDDPEQDESSEWDFDS